MHVLDILDSELTKISWKHAFFTLASNVVVSVIRNLLKRWRRLLLEGKMRLRGSHFALLQFCIRTQLIHFQDSQQLPSVPPSQLAPFMKRNFSWCFYILEWDKVGIWVYLPHNSLPCQRPISLISICLPVFFLFYRIMIIPPVVSFGTLISLSSNFSQKSYIPSCINTD